MLLGFDAKNFPKLTHKPDRFKAYWVGMIRFPNFNWGDFNIDNNHCVSIHVWPKAAMSKTSNSLRKNSVWADFERQGAFRKLAK